MNNYIVYEPSAKIREIAREALRALSFPVSLTIFSAW